MNVLEEAPPIAEESQRPVEIPMEKKLKSFSATLLLDRFLIALALFGLSVAACGLFAIKNQMFMRWNEAIEQYQWLVLVKGESLQVDEVGRFLRQLDAVAEVSYVSSEETLQHFQNDPDLSPGLSFLDGNPFPPCWKIRWKAELLNQSKMEETLLDIRTFPGVVDVAYDQTAISNIHRFRVHWYQVKVMLALLLLVGVLFGSILFGRFLFLTDFRKFSPRRAVLDFSMDMIFWTLGFLVVTRFLDAIPWTLLLGGVIVSACRLSWIAASKRFR